MGLIQSFTRPSGKNQRGTLFASATRIEPMDSRLFTAVSAVAANTAYLVWFRIDAPFTATAMEYICGAANGNVDLGIFSSPDFATFTLLGSTGATAASGSNTTQSINLTGSVVLLPGVDYYASLSGVSASLTVGKFSGFSASTFAAKTACQKAALQPLATFSTPAAPGLVPYLAIK
jgi:hypothetical protein